MISATGLSHAYNGGELILKKVTFNIQPGEKVVLLGTNGCGKSSLLKILNGLISPREGHFTYKDEPVTPALLKNSSFNRHFRSEVVLLFQSPDAMLFNPTVYDEIAFGLRQIGVESIDERVKHWADRFNLTRYLDRVPFQLSRGEKQKVCLASLLAIEPEVLLLDEPTANLDPRSTGWLVDYLQDVEITTLVTTHNLGIAAELGDRTLVLSENHELIYDGKIDELLGDTDKLIAANLVHVHKHKHGDVEHRHYHTHDWE